MIKLLSIIFILFSSSISFSQNVNFNKNIVYGGQGEHIVTLLDLIDNTRPLLISLDIFDKIIFTKIKKNENISFSRQEIVEKLKEIKKEYKELSNINFTVPQLIEVSHTGYSLNTRVAIETLKRSWKKKCITCKFIVGSVILPEITSEHKNNSWYIKPSSSLPKGSFSAQIIFSNSKSPATLWVHGQSHTHKPTAVVNRNIGKGEFISAEQVGIQYKNIEKISGAITDISDLENKITNKYLMAGDVIKRANLSEKVIFNRGELVKLIFDEGDLQVATTAIADSIGKIGHSVWVKNIKSKKRISGTVLKTGEVLVK